MTPEAALVAQNLSLDAQKTLADIKSTGLRPPADDRWDAFLECSDAGLVEDLGLGYAKITALGRAVLRASQRRRKP